MDGVSFCESDKEILVTIVKTAQQKNIQGTNGSWKEFLALNNVPLAQCDPASRPWQLLAAFVQSLTSHDEIQMVKRMKQWHKWSTKTRLAEKNDPWPETPEQGLVKLTRQNPNFHSTYAFPSFEEGWKWTKRGDSSSPQKLLSLDCEMVMCAGYEYEVVQVCIVDRNLETVLSTLVKPSKKVVDYITHIHGITSADLQKATCTQDEIQKKVKRLLRPGTILIGHSLNNDLKALKIDHRRVIDTSLMIRPKGVPWSSRVSLDALCKAYLGYSLRDEGKPHDCLEDAIVPMKLILQELQNGSSTQLIALEKVFNRDPSRLLIHKIPHHITIEEARKLVSETIPCTVEKVEGKKGQAYVIFPSKDLAKKAFEMLPGEIGQDSCGFEQKTVSRWIRAQPAEIRVRKMVHHDDEEEITGEEAEVARSSKRLKTGQDANQRKRR